MSEEFRKKDTTVTMFLLRIFIIIYVREIPLKCVS